MRNLNEKLPQMVIMSAYLDGLSNDENVERHQMLRQELLNNMFYFKEVAGSYKGHSEKGFAIVVQDTADVLTLQDIADEYAQESVLVLDEERQAFLFYMDGKPKELLGLWMAASKLKASELDAFTYDPSTGAYYIVVPPEREE